ncbi:hypothetical protein ACFSL6_03610 [Paenibacillus thailandensis]|uniref:Uncharacterized protein n=1 Tax=Paenibacillus thailandensis TaxID=393250 RepID=A0ABW5R4W7_9BACL
MKKKRVISVALALSISLVVGSVAGIAWSRFEQQSAAHSDLSINSSSDTLEEEFWNVDLIVQGIVISEGETFKKASGITTKADSSFDVTPATIQVNKVLYGNTDESTITFLQHGSDKDLKASKKFVEKGKEVILILTKTSSGAYWSYNFEDGIWKVANGKVTSDSASELLQSADKAATQGQDINSFIKKIVKAANNKVEK